MIRILAEGGTEPVAEQIATALSTEYRLARAPEVVSTSAVWSGTSDWDDLLLVVFRSRVLPDSAVQYIEAYRTKNQTRAAIIPVGANPAFRSPPAPISRIKAAQFDGSAGSTLRIVKAAGVFLGLALRPGSQRIFVSFRASDGKELAQAIHGRLASEGFTPWLDEAGENLVIGDDVQDKIRSNIESAAMVLLVDTPDAPDSKWVSVEIDLANSQLVPVLPVIAGGEQISRFVQLQGLRRQVVLKQSALDSAALADAEWESVRGEIDELLLSMFRRRLRILSRAQTTFEVNGYTWQVVDERLRMYRADRTTAHLMKMVIMSHCLVHDITYLPALRAYWSYLQNYADLASLNLKLCIYDRDRVLSDTEIDTLRKSIPGMNAVLAHYNELELLVSSNFTALRK
jgi:TIR domain